MFSWFVVPFVSLSLLKLHHALPECKQLDECSCMLSDGKQINIWSLGTKGRPRFPYEVQPDDKDYECTYNPCYDFSDEHCKNVVACQTTKDYTSSIGLGKAATAKWGSETSESYTISYEDRETSRSTLVELKCDKSSTTARLQVLGEKPGETGKMYFVLTTNCACPGECKGPTPTKETGSGLAISVGTIICISFSGLVIIYFICGVLFMKFVRRAVGLEVIPNVSLWISLSVYIKDGFKFVFSGGKRTAKYDEI
ncbi:cation-dependent mannose-6-phosphate receptor-like [Acanthaster planci]|uniref:Cation-dependent mannose-6-phosphate receptor-like n=1 Tax=Acanthaster planci TaxID=133434 RepID=A0A8B7Z0A6_ACAPL|nr:cation-dependent mannose-6-phosphate receptor-like [Acanthaster planci]